jgi:hypothetical protein
MRNEYFQYAPDPKPGKERERGEVLYRKGVYGGEDIVPRNKHRETEE